MNFNRLKSKLESFYKIFIAPPKQWRLPKKSEILIYDACGAEALAPYLTGYSVEIIPLRGEYVNIPCLLRAILKSSFWIGKPIQAYVEAFIQVISPKVVMTFIDNNPGFYTISSRFSGIKTILLQNGTRDNWLDRLNKKNKYHVDHMLIFNAAIGGYYCKFISGEAIVAGSLRNNGIKKSGDITNEIILFISQYGDKPKGNAPFHITPDETAVYHEQFYAAEVQVLNFLSKWCTENNKLLRICGRSVYKQTAERDFFAASLNECVWEYIPISDNNSPYKLVDAAGIVVFIDSTLGYESIGRGKRTAGFACRGNFLNTDARKFGWPAVLPDNGPFWTNDADKREFRQVMDYLNRVNDEEWEQTRRQYVSELMEFDPGNTRFIALLDQLLSKSEIPNFAQ